MKKILFILILLCCCQIINAQSSTHFGLFPTIDHSGTISKKWDYSLYYFGGFNLINEQENTPKEPANFFVFYSEQALTYKLNSNLSFTGSYVYERQYPTQSNYRNENRYYLQSTYKYKVNKTEFKHRLRFDGRYIQDRITNETPFTSRLRYLTGITTPLNKSNDKLYFTAYNEFFFNLQKSAAAIYGENWAYAGIGYKTKKAGNFEVGPLYIFWVNNKQNDLSKFGYLQFTWATHLDFTKK